MKLGIVDIGGSGNIPNALAVLRSMGVPSKAIADLDFAFTTAIVQRLIDPEHAAICGCKRIFARLEAGGALGLDAEGLPTKRNGVPAAKAYELMAKEVDARPFVEKLHEELLKQGIWIWNKGAIEAHLGLQNKKASTQIDFISRLKDEVFLNSLPDYDAVRKAFDWIRA